MPNKSNQGQRVASPVLNRVVKWTIFVLNRVGVWRPQQHSSTQTSHPRPYQRDSWINTLKLLKVSIEQAKSSTRVKAGLAALIEWQFNNTVPWQQDCWFGEIYRNWTGLDWTRMKPSHKLMLLMNSPSVFYYENTEKSNNNWPSKVRYCQLRVAV